MLCCHRRRAFLVQSSNTQEALWTLDLQSLLFSDGSTSQTISVASGALDMLRTGQWDATGQLVARDAELTRTMAALPYLHGF